jgi:hypothetical protein
VPTPGTSPGSNPLKIAKKGKACKAETQAVILVYLARHINKRERNRFTASLGGAPLEEEE